MKNIDKDGRFISIRKTVYAILKAIPDGAEFYGWELKRECVKVHPELKDAYIETFIKTMRYLRLKHGINIVCINRADSQYRKEAR